MSKDEVAARVRALSDDYYTIVPTKGGRSVLPAIDSFERLGAQLEVLDALAALRDDGVAVGASVSHPQVPTLEVATAPEPERSLGA